MLGRINVILETVCGLKLTRIANEERKKFADLSADVRDVIERTREYTMTSPERVAALCMAVEYTVRNSIPGAFVECGVWRGGSTMAAALTYKRLGREDTDLYLFDTFEGMTEPTEEDISLANGRKAKHLLETSSKSSEVWARASMEEVRHNLEKTGYPACRLHFKRGIVEKTVPVEAPGAISILRLDTDWYDSTKHELVHLFPRLSTGGILIIDDYGDWAGARKAVDEYFSTYTPSPFLGRIDSTGRICIKG